MTFYTRAFDVVPGSQPRSLPVEQEFDAIAAGFAAVAAAYGGAVRSIVGADTAAASDQGKWLTCSGTFTLSLTAAATLGAGWACVVRNIGAGIITIDPNAAELIDGLASGLVYPGFAFLVLCTGSAFVVQKINGTRIEVLASGASWVCPMGITRPKVTVHGAGASGAKNNTGNRATGGSAGGAAIGQFTSSPGTSYGYTIGAGGAAQSTVGANGFAGGNSTFNTGALTLTGQGAALTQTPLAGAPGGGTNGDINMTGSYGGGTGSSTTCFGGNSMLGSGGWIGLATVAAYGFGAGGSGGTASVDSEAGRPGVILLEY